MVNTSSSSKVLKEAMIEHIDLVWSNMSFCGATPEYFGYFDSLPQDTTALNEVCNNWKLKYIMVGKKI